jgi:hypothetical protein
MKQAAVTNIVKLPSPIARLWKKYVAAAAAKHRVYARWNRVEASGDANEIDRAEAACDLAYDDLADIAEAILQSRPIGLVDVAIQAQIITRRQADLGGPCTENEIANFCREVQIVAASAI